MFVLGFRLRRYFGFDQVLRAPGVGGPQLGGCRCRGLEEGGGVEPREGAPCLGGEGVVVLISPPYDVASLAVAVRGLGLGLLDGQGCPDVLRCLWVYGRGVCP